MSRTFTPHDCSRCGEKEAVRFSGGICKTCRKKIYKRSLVCSECGETRVYAKGKICQKCIPDIDESETIECYICGELRAKPRLRAMPICRKCSRERRRDSEGPYVLDESTGIEIPRRRFRYPGYPKSEPESKPLVCKEHVFKSSKVPREWEVGVVDQRVFDIIK